MLLSFIKSLFKNPGNLKEFGKGGNHSISDYS
jgi:hypothetical protein